MILRTLTNNNMEKENLTTLLNTICDKMCKQDIDLYSEYEKCASQKRSDKCEKLFTEVSTCQKMQ